MPKFRKKPIIIEAVQWTGDNMYELIAFSEASDAFIFAEALKQADR